MGSIVFTAILFAGILLSRIHGTWNETSLWDLFRAGDDDSVLHDSLRQTTTRNHCRHCCRNCARHVEFEKSFHYAWSLHSLQRGIDDGFGIIVAKRIVVKIYV